MTERRRGLGRGLGALIPTGPSDAMGRPTDIFFRESHESVSRETRSLDGPGDDVLMGAVADTEVQATGVLSGDDSTAPPDNVGVHAGVITHRENSGPTNADGGHAAETSDDARTVVDVVDAVDAVDAVDDESERDELDQSGQERSDELPGLAPVPGARYAEIPIDEIRPNPRQPRQVFDEDELQELSTSIKAIGVLQPVVVREWHDIDGTATASYELVMGERRWRAAETAGLTTIPAIVRGTTDDAMLRDALLENLHRTQLNPLEEAAAYQQLLEDFGCTHEELATRLGRSRPQISNTIRLLRLPPLVARRVAAGVLSAGHARALLGLEDGAAMERLAQRIVAEGLSVRAVEEIVALGDDKQGRARAPRAVVSNPELDDLALQLSDRFDTRVNISLGRKKGRLTVEFASVDDLNRIIGMLDVGGAERTSPTMAEVR